VVWCAVVVGAGVLARLLNGGETCLVAGLFGVFLHVLFTAGYVKGWRNGLAGPDLGKEVVFVGGGWAVLIVWFVAGFGFQTGAVHVDNFSSKDLRVDLDGKEWRSCPKGSTSLEHLRWGRHHVAVRSADGEEVLDEMEMTVTGRSVHVLNLLGAQTYEQGEVRYGVVAFTLFGGDTPRPVQIRERWFETQADFVFEPPPHKITASVKSGDVTRTYLKRGASRAKD
jgi:hypothetical protein